MKNKVLSSLFILCCCGAYSQVTKNVGINNQAPTETLDVNGTTRLRELPVDGQMFTINTKPDGTSSNTKNQNFLATKTVVVDANGVLGTIVGLPITETPDVKAIQYSSKTVFVDSSTPGSSITSLGNLSMRYNHTSGSRGNHIEFRVNEPNIVTANAKLDGDGGTGYEDWKRTLARAGTWYKATSQSITVDHNDTYTVLITLLNTREIYRVTLIGNEYFAGDMSLGIPSIRGQITIFIEKLG